MLLNDIQPFVRHARHFTISESTPSACKDVRTRDNRIFFVTGGDADICIEGNEERLKRDTLVLIRAGKSYKIVPNPSISVIVINFDFTDTFSSIKQSFRPFPSDFPGTLEDISFDDTDVFSEYVITHEADIYEDRVRNLITDSFDKQEWERAFLSSTLKALILDLAMRQALTSEKKRASHRLVSDVKSYIKEHYSERVENETLSEHFHFTSVYINRIFKAEVGKSVHQYLISLRIEIAKELLTSGEYTPYVAAFAVGFDDYPHFSKTFKKIVGKSPSEFLKCI